MKLYEEILTFIFEAALGFALGLSVSILNKISLYSNLLGLRDFLYNWQPLIGAIMGASAPLIIYLVIRRFYERRDHIVRIYKTVLIGINNAMDVWKGVDDFRNLRIPEMLQQLQIAKTEGIPFVGKAFFPPLARIPLSEVILEKHCGSDYVETQLLFALTTSKNFSLLIDDAQKKFESTLEDHLMLMTQKFATNTTLNTALYGNMELYRDVFLKDYFFRNLSTYLNILAKAKIATRAYLLMGGWRWRSKFEPSFRYFKNKASYREYAESTQEKIGKYLEPEFEKEFKSMLETLPKQI